MDTFMLEDYLIPVLPLLLGWGGDLLFGDPVEWPHPIVWFGRWIGYGEKMLNRGTHRRLKGAVFSIFSVLAVYAGAVCLSDLCGEVHIAVKIGMEAVLIFFCLAGTTLIREVQDVFIALEHSLEDGRRQVARIVGRDTAELTAQEVRVAALETLAENLNDGVIAPLFWYALAGVPGMVAYKMINTLDSMIGYRNERYKEFGCVSARMDDIANYLPARLTALLMAVVSGNLRVLSFIRKYGRQHASPNSGYPESALAGILNCRFGGPHNYFGEVFDKPYIGTHDRPLNILDMDIAVRVNRRAEIVMLALVALLKFL